jgi:hypothetical protein
MRIEFVSSLTPDDEARCAASLVRLAAQVLDKLPIAYVLRVETADAKTFSHVHPRQIASGPSPS